MSNCVNEQISKPSSCNTRRALRLLFILFIFASRVSAQEIPQLTSIFPQGGKRGATVEVALQGKALHEITALWFSGKGVQGEIKAAPNQPTIIFSGQGISGQVSDSQRLLASVTIAPDAPLGKQELRLVTPHGVSNPQPFVVGDLPETLEVEPNSSPDTAAPIHPPVTISGRIESVEDEDFYRFTLKPGQRLICEVNASRIGSPLDSFLTLFAPDGKKVASNAIGAGLDALIDYTASAEGAYTLQIQDLRRQGGQQYVYRLSVGELPYLDSLFPLGGRRNAQSTVSINGRNLMGVKSMQLFIEPNTPLGVQEVRVTTASGLSTNPRPFAVGDLPEFMEAEANSTPEQANKVTPPVSINGQMGSEGDVDYFQFEAKTGERLILEATARRLGSALDALLTLMDAKGKQLAVNDDAIGAEARIDFTFQEAGAYVVALRDLNNQSGPNFAYRLMMAPPTPDFRVTVAPDNPRIYRGGATPLTLSVVREGGFSGPLQFTIPNLSRDFTISPATLAPDQTQALIMLTAPPDAATGLLPITVVGVGAVENRRAERLAQPDPILLTVMESPKFLLELAEVHVSAMQTKSTTLHVKAKRQEGFEEPINLGLLILPGGDQQFQRQIPTIAPDQTEATITLTAGNFVGRELFPVLPPAGTQYLAVSGSVTIENEPVTQWTNAIPFTIIESPFVVSVTPVRQSMVLPLPDAPSDAREPESEYLPLHPSNPPRPTATPPRRGEGAGKQGSEGAASEQSSQSAIKEAQTVEAVITVSVARQGTFTDKVDISLVGLPEGMTGAEASIPQHEKEVKVTLTATPNVKPDTYEIKFIGAATVNGRKFEMESPPVQVKIIGAEPLATSE